MNTPKALLPVLLALLGAARGAGGQLTHGEHDLVTRLRDGAADAGVVAAFWSEVGRVGAPLVGESVSGDSAVVTFVAREGRRDVRVRLVSSLPGNDQAEFARVGSTDVWLLSRVVARDLRLAYRIERSVSPAGPETAVDPLNRRVFPHGSSSPTASVLELRGAPRQPWKRAATTGGSWAKLPLSGDTARPVWVYTPAGFDRTRAEPYPALIGLSSVTFGVELPTARIIDLLIAEGRIPPIVVILTDMAGDLASQDETARPGQLDSTVLHIEQELLPWARRALNVTADPHRIVLAGASRRGLAAAYVAYQRPELIGNVLALSGSFYWRPDASSEFEWLTGEIARSANRPVRFFFSAGTLEIMVTERNHGHYPLAAARHLRDVLDAKGYSYHYRELSGGHHLVNWQDELADGVAFLMGRSNPALRETLRAADR